MRSAIVHFQWLTNTGLIVSPPCDSIPPNFLLQGSKFRLLREVDQHPTNHRAFSLFLILSFGLGPPLFPVEISQNSIYTCDVKILIFAHHASPRAGNECVLHHDGPVYCPYDIILGSVSHADNSRQTPRAVNGRWAERLRCQTLLPPKRMPSALLSFHLPAPHQRHFEL